MKLVIFFILKIWKIHLKKHHSKNDAKLFEIT